MHICGGSRVDWTGKEGNPPLSGPPHLGESSRIDPAGSIRSVLIGWVQVGILGSSFLFEIFFNHSGNLSLCVPRATARATRAMKNFLVERIAMKNFLVERIAMKNFLVGRIAMKNFLVERLCPPGTNVRPDNSSWQFVPPENSAWPWWPWPWPCGLGGDPWEFISVCNFV